MGHERVKLAASSILLAAWLHLLAGRDSSGNPKINSRLCKKRAGPQKKGSSPLFRSLERALEKRGSDLRVPAASILFLTRFLYPSSQLFYQFHRHYRLLNYILSCPFPCRKNLIKGVFEYDSTYFIVLAVRLTRPRLLLKRQGKNIFQKNRITGRTN